jgi:hypothetical protein
MLVRQGMLVAGVKGSSGRSHTEVRGSQAQLRRLQHMPGGQRSWPHGKSSPSISCALRSVPKLPSALRGQ